MSNETGGLRYRAFISYSHADEAIARRLHRRLETYRPPRGLNLGDSTARARIQPVFRDRDELAGGGHLSTAIETALDQSAALVVIGSPNAVASRWVGEEIRRFRLRHPDLPVLAFVIAGDPACDPRNDPDHAALPLPLLLTDPVDDESALLEPLAADARDEGDGFSAAFLKLAASLLGVGYDQLRQRELRRRQRWWSLAIAVSLILMAAFAMLAWQAMQARDAAQLAQARAELELRSEQQTRGFLLSVFELADAGKSRGEKITVREVLDRAVARIDHTRFDRPEIKSRFLATMGQAYASLGITHRSVELLSASLEALPATEQSFEASAQRIDSRLILADTHLLSGDYAAALQLLDQTRPSQAPADSPGLQPTALQLATATLIRGDAMRFQEQDSSAEAAYERVIDSVRTQRFDQENSARLASRALVGLAVLRQYAGDFDAADAYFQEALDILLPVFGENHPDTLATVLSRASNSYAGGRLDDTRQQLQRSLDIATRLYDPLSPEVGSLKNNLGRMALETDDIDAAERLLNDAIASDRKFRTEGFDDLTYPLNSLAMVKLAHDDEEASRQLLDEALSIARASDHPMLGPVTTHRAALDCQQSPSSTSLKLAKEGLQISHQRQDLAPWQLAEARLTTAYCLARLGHTDDHDADRHQARTDLETIRQHFPNGNIFTRRAEDMYTAVSGG